MPTRLRTHWGFKFQDDIGYRIKKVETMINELKAKLKRHQDALESCKLAEQGDVDAQCEVGDYYLYRWEYDQFLKDESEYENRDEIRDGVKWFKLAAAQGDAHAQEILELKRIKEITKNV